MSPVTFLASCCEAQQCTEIWSTYTLVPKGRSLRRDTQADYNHKVKAQEMSDQRKIALMGGAAIIIAMLLWIYFSFLN